MKILHIINSIGIGGAERFVQDIFEKEENNKNIFLFALEKREPCLSINHQNVITHNSKGKYSIKPLGELKRLIRKEKIDILHCHLFKSQIFGLMLKILYFPDIKLVFHEHGEIYNKTRLNPFVLRLFQSKVDLFLAVSNGIKQKLIERANIDQKRIKILYNFVDLNKFNRNRITWNIQEERRRLGIGEKDFVVGLSGRIIERKGWRDFIEVAKLLLENGSIFKFLIASIGRDKDKMLKMIRDYKLDDKIQYLGYQSDMVKFYSLLDCFVMPSHWEGMPMTQLEAMAMGIPLVCTNGPGMEEIPVDHQDALFSEIKNPLLLAENILKIVNDKILRTNLVNSSLKKVRECSLEIYIIKLNDIHREVLC